MKDKISYLLNKYPHVAELLKAVVIILPVYAVLYIIKAPCPLYGMFGISCPGCGMTRAWLALLRGKFGLAFEYHPLYIYPLIFLVGYTFKNDIKPIIIKISAYFMLVSFIVVYFIRLYYPGNVVVFEPHNGLVFKILSHF